MVQILTIIRYRTRNQCREFRSGLEQVKHGDLFTTFAKLTEVWFCVQVCNGDLLVATITLHIYTSSRVCRHSQEMNFYYKWQQQFFSTKSSEIPTVHILHMPLRDQIVEGPRVFFQFISVVTVSTVHSVTSRDSQVSASPYRTLASVVCTVR